MVCDDINKCIQKLNNHSKLAVAVSRSHISGYRSAENIDFFCFAKLSSVYSFPVSIVSVHQFHLLPKINQYIGQLLEHGLISKWVRVQYYGSLEKKGQERRYYAKNFGLPQSDKMIILTVNHISGAIVILYIGYGVALIVFAIEVMIGEKLQSLKKKFNFCFALEKIISVDCIFQKK